MLTYYVIVPILIAVFLYLFSDKLDKVFSIKTGKVIAIAAQLMLVVGAFYLFYQTQVYGYVLTNVGNFRDFLGIYLMADTITAVFILLSSIIFLAAAIFSINENHSNLFWFLLFIWESALIGLFLTRDMFNLFVMIEVATVVVAVLLMYDRDKRRIYDGMIFLLTNVVAIKFYLFGIGYIYMLTGRMDIYAATEVLQYINPSQLYLPYALIMTAIVFKCALLPLSSWFVKVSAVPRAPIAIATILSAMHVKGGIYLFIRFQQMLGGIVPSEFYIIIGIITGLIGVVMALAQKDILLLLAYSSVAQVGLIIIALKMGTPYAYAGGLYHAINHAIFKAALFFGAGMIAQRYGTRDVNKIRGLWQRDKVLAIAQILAILGIIGVPFFNGSISKYFMAADANFALTIAMTTINLGTILVYLKYGAILLGKNEQADDYKVDKCKQFTVFALGVMCLLFGVFGEWMINFLFGFGVSIDVWGFVEKALIFAVSLAVGLVIVRFAGPINKRLETFGLGVNFGFRGICASIGGFFGVMLVVIAIL